VVLVNDGDEPVSATLRLFPAEGGPAGEPYTLVVPPGRTASPPRNWLQADPTAAIAITGDADLVALSSGTTGRDGAAGYALAMGIPFATDTLAAP
jgi:hypothetical protein